MCFKKDKQTQLPQDLDYIKTCFSENLSHARHVENERLTFTSIYIAMVIGAVAVVPLTTKEASRQNPSCLPPKELRRDLPSRSSVMRLLSPRCCVSA